MNTKRPTIRDVAKIAEVAPTTVSRVLNNKGYISDETRQRVEAAVAELNYIPNALSQSLRYQKTDTVALVVSDITNPFWTTVARGVEDVCQAHSLHVILCNTDEKQDKLANYVNMLLQRQTDGFLLVPISSENDAVVRKILQKEVPLVVIDRRIEGVEVDTVRSASDEGTYLLTNHLLGLGHRHVAILTGAMEIYTSQQRISGYVRALEEAHIPVDEDLIVTGNFTTQSGYEMTKTILSRSGQRPTALIAGNNFVAVGILRRLKEMNLKIPDDISVVSFDRIPFDTNPDPFLTLVAQDPYVMGQRAAELLIQRISRQGHHSEEVILPLKFIKRRSAAPPSKNS